MSIAVWVGLIALLGVDAETAVFMLLYLTLPTRRFEQRRHPLMGRSARGHCSRSGQALAAQSHDRFLYALRPSSYYVVHGRWSRCHEAHRGAMLGGIITRSSWNWSSTRLSCNLEMELGSQAGAQA